MTALIDCCFDGGNIRRLHSDDDSLIRLAIEPDAGGEFFQWFYFRLTAKRSAQFNLVIDNASLSSYPAGWNNYQVVVSTDQKNWHRIPTHYDGKQIGFLVEMPGDVLWFAYFAPYSLQRHSELIARVAAAPNVGIEVPGHSIDGRSIDCVVIGDKNRRVKIWAIGRQHPGESMAQWWMEGYLDRLCDQNDPVVRELLKQAVFYTVPNMNPDGSYRGYLRTNATGTNLNREWSDPSLERSPEVYCVRQKMHNTGLNFCLDVHGDEAIAYNFIAGTEGIDSWNDERLSLQNQFKNNLQGLNPDFQTIIGYPATPAGRANYGICSNYIAEHFRCPALTLEMPFKDTEQTPNKKEGWSATRSASLGRSCVDAIYSIIEQL